MNSKSTKSRRSRSWQFGQSAKKDSAPSPKGATVIAKTLKGHKFVEKAISRFEIRLSEPEDHVYRPGDQIKGKVILEITTKMDLQFVELNLEGKGQLTWASGSAGTKTETYLSKQSIMIGSTESSAITVLDPGRYDTAFQYRLPKDLPPTTEYSDPNERFRIEISYKIQARICDYSMSNVNNGHKFFRQQLHVLQEHTLSFDVAKRFNISKVKGAMMPIYHAEYLNIKTCSIMQRHPEGVVKFHLNRSVLELGENIVLNLEINTDYEQSARNLGMELEQKISIKGKQQKMSMIVASVNKPIHQGNSLNFEDQIFYHELMLHIPINLFPSLFPNVNLLEVTYMLKVCIEFSGNGGRLKARIPITITPPSNRRDSIASMNSVGIPVFYKPKTFNSYNSGGHRSAGRSLDRRRRDTRAGSASQSRIWTQYKPTSPFGCF